MPSKVIHFKEIIQKMPPRSMGAWHYIDFPENAYEVFGKRNFVKVKGFINDKPFKSNLFPKGNGLHAITIPLKLQKQLGIKLHDEITLSVEEDFEIIPVPMPTELQEALDFDEEMNELFFKQTASVQKFQKIWINDGKHIETRINRVVTLSEKLRKGRKQWDF
jgi:antitoxin component of MazEF toxin-antitoxin module